MVGRRRLGSAEQPNEGDAPTPSGEGSSSTGGTNQVWSRAQTLGLGSVGKALATGSEHRNFHGLVETLFWRLKGGTQHGGSINACVHAQKHTVTLPLFFFYPHPLAYKTHQQLGGGLQPSPYYHSNGISHIWGQMKTLWAATGIFILQLMEVF